MKRTWITLLMALVLALGGICGAAAQTAADLETAIRGTWELESIVGLDSEGGEDAGEDSVAAVISIVKAMGGGITMGFAGGKCVMTMSILGNNQSEEITYTLEGDRMNLGGSDMDVGVNGDKLYLTMESVTMILTRIGDAPDVEPDAEPAAEPGAETPAGPAEGLLGVWLITDVVAEDADSDTLPARIKPTFDNGDELKMTFTADKVSIALNGEDVEEANYTADGDTIMLGSMIGNYVIDAEGKLYFIEGDDRIVMIPADAPEAPKAEIPEGGYGLEGTWELTSAEGDEVGIAEYQAMLGMGATITMTFADGRLSMKAEFMGKEQEAEIGEYKLGDGYFEVNGAPIYYTIEGDTLTLNESGAVMTLVRVTE